MTEETAPIPPTPDGRTPPFAAYDGDGPYAFICYSHENRQPFEPEN